MTTSEPPAEPERRPIDEIIDQFLARNLELDHGDGPGGQAYYVLEVRGVPQVMSGPYQAEPEHEIAAASPEPEADADLWTGPEWDAPLDTGPEAEAEWADEWDCADSTGYQARVEADPEPEAEP
jgi:hypothetical protein